MIGAGQYILSAAGLAALGASLAFSAYSLRRRLIPDWEGAPARLVEAITGLALLIWLSELLGVMQILYAGTLLAASLVVAGAVALWLRPAATPSSHERTRGQRTPVPGGWSLLVMTGVIALVVAHWGLTTDSALNRGIFNFDSLWYHMPFATEIAKSHSVTGFHHNETVFANWFYPQNSELLHSVGILFAERDTLSLFLNYGWLAVAFLAAWTIGRPYGRGHLSVVAVAILLASHILIVREPAAAKNDLAVAALLLSAIAILLTAWTRRNPEDDGGDADRPALPVGWPLAAAGLAVGLAAGTKVTVLAIVGALTVTVVVLAPPGRRRVAAAWWVVPALLGGGYWYLRNLVAVGNPIPEIGPIGPVSLPHPEHLQEARPDFDIAHYATDTGVWSEYFFPGLHSAFGGLWPVVLLAALGGALLALGRGRNHLLRWVGGVVLFGVLAYLFTPLSAAGLEGRPTGFELNIRYVLPALLAGLALLPLPRALDDRRRQSFALAGLVLLLVLTDRADAVVRDPSRLFGIALGVLLVLVPAGLLLLRSRGSSRGSLAAGLAVWALALVAIGYPVQRDYLGDRFANAGPREEWIPGYDLDFAYRWAQDVEDARIGLAGTTAGFLQYGFYGRDLSNEVVYLGKDGPHGSFNAIPTCEEFRKALNQADLDYLVTSPFLNFNGSEPIASPEKMWLAGQYPGHGTAGAADSVEKPLAPVVREGDVTVWSVRGDVDTACGPGHGPLRSIPDS